MIFKPLVRLMQMIWRWIAMENAQLYYLCQFSEIPYNLRAVLKIRISVLLNPRYLPSFYISIELLRVTK